MPPPLPGGKAEPSAKCRQARTTFEPDILSQSRGVLEFIRNCRSATGKPLNSSYFPPIVCVVEVTVGDQLTPRVLFPLRARSNHDSFMNGRRGSG